MPTENFCIGTVVAEKTEGVFSDAFLLRVWKDPLALIR
jgi:hypothetical protein